MNTAIVTLCLACLIVLAVYVVVKLASSDREEKLTFLKNFKKGKFALIYLVAVPLYFIACRFDGTSAGESILISIRAAVRLVVLNFEYDPVLPLMAADLYFRVVMDVCFVLVTLNALIFTFTLFGQTLINGVKCRRSLRGKSRLYVIVGFNPQNVAIMKSVTRAMGRAVLFADLGQKEKDEIFVAGKSYLRFRPRQDLGAVLLRNVRLTDRSVRVIVNTGDDSANLILVKQLSAMMESFAEADRAASDWNVYAFGEPENVSSFVHFEEKTKGKVHYINKYRLIATDFVGRFPLTRFMTEEQIDYEAGALRADVDVNVVMVGFGKTNHRIFLTSVANDQLFTAEHGYRSKPVSYWIFDKADSNNDKNLNHNYYRYRNSLPYLEQAKDAYFPLPDQPADLGPLDAGSPYRHFIKMDINDGAFYRSVREKLLPKDGRKAFNYIVIAFGGDLENFDLAEKLRRKLLEWDLAACTKLFVKIRSDRLSERVIEAEYAADQYFYVFGNENKIVYSADRIVREETEAMAQYRHLCYTAESCRAGTEEAVRDAAIEKWYGKWNQVQRESNVYACLSLRMKLNLLGYDYLPAAAGLKDASADFLAAYQAGDPIRYTGAVCEGRKVVDYGDCRFKTDTVRAHFAEQEHQRWNAYMLTSGYLPAKIDDVLHRYKTELMQIRTHGNLTTFEGLIRYRDLLAETTGADQADVDVIKYDYQIMDDAIWLLHASGYVIVSKENAEHYREDLGI